MIGQKTRIETMPVNNPIWTELDAPRSLTNLPDYVRNWTRNVTRPEIVRPQTQETELVARERLFE
jgi:hypothetical protein